MEYSLFDFLGNIGISLIIISYFLLQLSKIKASGLFYSIANLFGALLVIISLLKDYNLSALIIEIFWVGISIIGIIRRILVIDVPSPEGKLLTKPNVQDNLVVFVRVANVKLKEVNICNSYYVWNRLRPSILFCIGICICKDAKKAGQ